MARRIRHLPDGSTTGQIGIHDPFELIRHLARSQSDPRKAVAELVQNALDEQATHVRIERFRDSDEPVLSILDDGTGVIPELSRRDALTTIASNIGHSRKRQLTFDQRMRAAMLGQYGIGLLGFWAVGHELRIISRVGDSEVWALTLFEDSPRYTVARVPDVIDRGRTWTEVQIRRLHRTALSHTAGSRLSNYLSVELRGQLVRHGTELRLVDRLGRTADRDVIIKPTQLAGERLVSLDPVSIPGFAYPVDVTLHYAGDAGPDSGRVRLACAGAVVLDDVAELPELAHAPWDDPRLVGVVDFPHLGVPPGSRRGVVPDEASAALVRALLDLEDNVVACLEERSRAEASAVSEELHRQLARLFARITTLLPHLEWFPVAKRPGTMDGAPSGSLVAPAEAQAPDAKDEADGATQLFAPGPLASVTVRPARVELAVTEERKLLARALDSEGRRLREGVQFLWQASAGVKLDQDGDRASLEGLHLTEDGWAEVVATQGGRVCSSRVPVRVVTELQRRIDAGVPQPEELDEPLQSWRSRLVDARWQINTGHPDYRTLSQETRPRLRYLAMLLAKEVVSRNFPQPGVGAILEELVGLLAALEKSGAWSGRMREDG